MKIITENTLIYFIQFIYIWTLVEKNETDVSMSQFLGAQIIRSPEDCVKIVLKSGTSTL